MGNKWKQEKQMVTRKTNGTWETNEKCETNGNMENK